MKSIVKSFMVLIVLALAISSCSDNSDLLKEKEMRLLRQYMEANNLDVQPEDNGLYFISHGGGEGTSPTRMDWVIVRYTARLINNRIFDATDENTARNANIYSSNIIYGDQRINLNTLGLRGVLEGLRMMREGEKATLIIPSELGYGSQGSGIVPGYSTLIYEIELVRVINDPLAYETELIEGYLSLYSDSTHLTIEKLESGTYFIELEPGTGEKLPEEGDQVGVYYRGTLTDGRLFDSKTSGTPFRFTIGSHATIAGFEEGVKLMKTEGRSVIVIPSTSGYGQEGTGKIPGYTPLVFELELVTLEEK